MAALHLRSGDIVHGPHRRRLVFADKVIPSTLAKAIVADLSSQGLTTLLIGQDAGLIESSEPAGSIVTRQVAEAESMLSQRTAEVLGPVARS